MDEKPTIHKYLPREKTRGKYGDGSVITECGISARLHGNVSNEWEEVDCGNCLKVRPTIKNPRKKAKLGNYEFQCEGCGEIQVKSPYCVAQQRMYHDITFTCPNCKTKMEVP